MKSTASKPAIEQTEIAALKAEIVALKSRISEFDFVTPFFMLDLADALGSRELVDLCWRQNVAVTRAASVVKAAGPKAAESAAAIEEAKQLIVEYAKVFRAHCGAWPNAAAA
jgi:hypothetical protein